MHLSLSTLDEAPVGLRHTLDFELPPEREAVAPIESRGLPRDSVRLLVSHHRTDVFAHTAFDRLGEHLLPGDLLVVNTSGTLPAALAAERGDGGAYRVHVSTALPDGRHIVEVRRQLDKATAPFFDLRPGEVLRLPAGGSVRIESPAAPGAAEHRLWRARFDVGGSLIDYLSQHGEPIRYSYVQTPWPLEAYQTIFATEPGSAEMPSAGRAFTPELVTRLIAQGVRFAPVLLHTGVSSLESHEPPYAEYYRVSQACAQLVNQTRTWGGRVIAIGTTVVRALESAVDPRGQVRASAGLTRHLVTPERGVRVVDGLLTGFHEPRATHLAMLEAIAGRSHLERAYAEALAGPYLWHEFGDLHLILP